MSFVSTKGASTYNQEKLGQLRAALESSLNASNSPTFIPTAVARKVALESGDFDDVAAEVNNAGEDVKNILLNEGASENSTPEEEAALRTATEAGAIGALVAAAGRSWFNGSSRRNVPALESGIPVIQNYMSQTSSARLQPAMENFDDRELKNTTIHTTILNYRAARQNEFGEALFPTEVLAMDQTGKHVFMEQINVMRDVKHTLSGQMHRYFERVNLMRAAFDHTILDLSETDLIPVYDEQENKHLFVEDTVIDPRDVPERGHKTQFLKFGQESALLGISQNEALIKAGLLDSSDALDPAISLDKLLMVVGNNKLVLDNLQYLTSSNFFPAMQGDSREMILAFNSQNYPINKNTKQHNGTDLVDELAQIATSEFVVRLKMSVSGNVNLASSVHSLMNSNIVVASIADKDGNAVDMTTGAGKAIVDAFRTAKLEGYELKLRRVNTNKRTRGLLLDMSSYSIFYAVPLHGPISARRALSANDDHRESDLAALIAATRMYNNSLAVTALLDIAKLLEQYCSDRDLGSDIDSEYLGISRRVVTPTYMGEKLDIKDVVASLKSEDRPLQVQATIVNKLRDMVFQAWYDSGLGVAAEFVFGGEAPKPRVIIATDPVISRYLQVQGDLRTIGGDFEVKIVTSWDKRVRGKLFMAFSYQTADGESNYHPLNFGMSLWKPEVVTVAPIYREGATTNELTVQPSVLKVCNTPILMQLELRNLHEAAVGQIPVRTAP